MKRSNWKTSIRRCSRLRFSSSLERRAVGCRSRSSPAATSAAGARRGARSGRRSCRSRRRASAAARRAGSRPATPIRRIEAGIRPIRSGVRLRFSGSSAGSPLPSPPSGFRCAARWPWVRYALSSEVAACTACSSSSSTAAGDRRAGRGAAAWLASGGAEAEAGWALETMLGVDVERRRRPSRRSRRSPWSSCVDPAQERARLGALDDPVVVGGRHRHHLRDAERLELVRRRRAPTRAGRRSSRWRRSCPARPSGAGPRRRCRARPGWSG